MLMTLTFQGYFGFWKNNRPEGKGLIIFSTGEIIYGEFCRNALVGAAIVDDGKFMRVGVFEGKLCMMQAWTCRVLVLNTHTQLANGGCCIT